MKLYRNPVKPAYQLMNSFNSRLKMQQIDKSPLKFKLQLTVNKKWPKSNSHEISQNTIIVEDTWLVYIHYTYAVPS